MPVLPVTNATEKRLSVKEEVKQVGMLVEEPQRVPEEVNQCKSKIEIENEQT